MIVAQVLTDQHTDDPSQVEHLLDQIDEEICKVMADGAYDGAPTYQTIAQYGDDIEVVIPPRKTAVPGTDLNSLVNTNITAINSVNFVRYRTDRNRFSHHHKASFHHQEIHHDL